MKREDISEAVGNISTKHIQEAAPGRGAKKRPRWLMRGAIAACLCLAIAGGVLFNNPSSDFVFSPGLFTITACAMSPSEEVDFMEEHEMAEGVKLSAEYNWSPAMSSIPGLPLKLSVADYPNATFNISVDGGQCVLWNSGKVTPLETDFSIDNGTTIYWSCITGVAEDGTGVQHYTENEAYIDVVVRDGDSIIGYAVIKVYNLDPENEPAQSYYAVLLKSVSFPKVEGEYQKVTDKYINSQIEQVKAAD